MDLKQIQELIRFVSKAGVSEVQLEQDDFKIVIKTGKEAPLGQAMAAAPQQVYHAAMPVQVTPQAPAEASQNAVPAAPKAAADESKFDSIKSPMIGTFYRKPSPDKDVFVKVGDTVSKGQVVCVIEAMKLFNEIESDVSGKIVKILVEDASPVEYDQPLFLVEPA